MNMSQEKREEIIRRLAANAKDADRRGDVIARNQACKDIEDASPSRAYAKKVINDIMGR